MFLLVLSPQDSEAVALYVLSAPWLVRLSIRPFAISFDSATYRFSRELKTAMQDFYQSYIDRKMV